MQVNTFRCCETQGLPSDGRAEPSGGCTPLFPVQKPADALKELKELKQVTFTKHHHYPAAGSKRAQRDLGISSAVRMEARLVIRSIREGGGGKNNNNKMANLLTN